MKILLIGLLISASITSFAESIDSSNCGTCNHPKKIRGGAVSNLSAIEKLTGKIVKLKPQEVLGGSICWRFLNSNDLTSDIEKVVKKHYNKQQATKKNPKKPTAKNLVDFLNTNNDFLTCMNNSSKEGEQHSIYKRAMSESGAIKHVLYKYFFKLSKEAGVKIDFNPVELVDGKFETPLDYLIKEKAECEFESVAYNQLKSLELRLVKLFDARTFEDLNPEVKNHYISNAKYESQ